MTKLQLRQSSDPTNVKTPHLMNSYSLVIKDQEISRALLQRSIQSTVLEHLIVQHWITSSSLRGSDGDYF